MAFKHILLLIATLYVLNEACKGDSTGIEIPLLRGESTARLVHGGHGLGTKPYTSRDDPIGGGISVLGTYYVQVLANGHPLRLLVDTGSTTTYLPEDGCHLYDGSQQAEACHVYSQPLSVAETDPVACRESACSACNQDQCIVSTTYLDGSGVYAVARSVNVSLGSFEAPYAVCGLVYRSSRGFRYDASSKIDGLLGMGFTPKNGFPTVYDLWVLHAGINDVFALQLGQSGGALSIGGYNPNYFDGDLNWTPMVGSSTHYVIPNPVISLDGVSGNIKASKKTVTIVDSGTTHLLVPETVFSQLSDAITSYLTRSLGKCPYNVCTDWSSSILNTARCTAGLDTQGWPTINFELERKMSIYDDKKEYFTVSLQPSEYFIIGGYQGSAPCYTFGISKGPDNQIIFGDTFMTAYYSIFDRQNRRLGFAHSAKSSQVVPTDSPITLEREPDLSQGSIVLATFWIFTLLGFLAFV